MSVSQEDFALRLKSCSKSMLWLLLVAVLLFTALSLFAFPRHGSIGVVAAAASTFLCFFSASAALFVTGLWAGTPNAVSGIFLGVFLRTAVPFLVSILLTQAISPLADAGLFAMVLVNFLVLLTVETILVVRIVHTHTSTVYR